METSVQDRFTNLFASDPMPAPAKSDQPHMSEVEALEKSIKEPSWTVPNVGEYPRPVNGPAPRPGRGDDILTSSDDDDYASAFAQKPKMQTPKKMMNSMKPQSSKLPRSKLTGDDADEEWESTSAELPTVDKLGNHVTGHFCPLNLVKTFPYKYMSDPKDRVSRHFFANNKFFERTWDLYYVHPPVALYKEVVLLLPYSQVQQLVDEIAATFKAEVSVPSFPFTLSFYDDGTPQPQFLGTTKSRAAIKDLQDQISSPAVGHGEPPHDASPAVKYSFDAFKNRIGQAVAANKKKKAGVKKKERDQDRFTMIQDWCKQLRRAQRYFGLRPHPGKVPLPPPNLTWAEEQAFIKASEKKAHLVLDPLDVTNLAPFPFEKEPIIVSVDIESYERNHSIVTEIGISTLDTLDLADTYPGAGGVNWMKHIRSRHFRIKGREHLINKDFVRGHPEDFQFGESEFINIEDTGKAIDSCFEWPFSVQYKHHGRLKNDAGNWESSDRSGAPVNTSTTSRPRDNSCADDSLPASDPIDDSSLQRGPHQRMIIILGHDLQADLSYLASLNSRVFSAPRPATYPQPIPDPSDADNPLHSILEALDTAILYKTLCKDTQTRNLASMMSDLGRTALYPHCGGNDARYTMEALVALVVRARLQDDAEEAASKDAVNCRLEGNSWK